MTEIIRPNEFLNERAPVRSCPHRENEKTTFQHNCDTKKQTPPRAPSHRKPRSLPARTKKRLFSETSHLLCSPNWRNDETWARPWTPRAIVLQVPATCCALDPRSYRFFFQAGMQNATGKQEARVGTFCAGNKRIRRNENWK